MTSTMNDVELARARAQLERDERAADAAAGRAEKLARRQAVDARRAHRRARQAAGRAAALAAGARAGRWARPVAPLLVVTGFAMYGQISYGVDAYSPAGWPLGWRLAVAIGAAGGVESIALYVQWHAHDALLMGATATAARMRRASYLLAAAVAAVNYAHFSDGWAPTPAAVVFALFSAAGPWLWGLHTRRAHHLQLLREGQVDTAGAVFSAERLRAFPIRSWAARRWSIDHGVTDPLRAWTGYNAERSARRQQRTVERAVRRERREADRTAGRERRTTGRTTDGARAEDGPPAGPRPVPARTGPSARSQSTTSLRTGRSTDEQVISDILAWPGGPPEVKDVRARYGMRYDRAHRLLGEAQQRRTEAVGEEQEVPR